MCCSNMFIYGLIDETAPLIKPLCVSFKQEVLAKSLPGVPAASLKLFFRQVNSGPPLTPPSCAGGQVQHNEIQQQPYRQQEQQYQQLQQHAADEQPHWHSDAGGLARDDITGDAGCRQATPPPMPQYERYQVSASEFTSQMPWQWLPLLSDNPRCSGVQVVFQGSANMGNCIAQCLQHHCRHRRHRRRCLVWT